MPHHKPYRYRQSALIHYSINPPSAITKRKQIFGAIQKGNPDFPFHGLSDLVGYFEIKILKPWCLNSGKSKNRKKIPRILFWPKKTFSGSNSTMFPNLFQFDLKRTDPLLDSMELSRDGNNSSSSNSLPMPQLSRPPPRLPPHKDRALMSDTSLNTQKNPI